MLNQRNFLNVTATKLKTVVQKHSYNVAVPQPQSGTVAGNHPEKKMRITHVQVFNLVAHCLDDAKIEIFLSCYNCIKTKSTEPNKSVKAFIDCAPPFVNRNLAQFFGNEKICKTPAWALAHCLLCVTSNGKTYQLSKKPLQILGKAVDNVYIIVGKLNTHYSPDDKSLDDQKHLPVGPKTNYVEFSSTSNNKIEEPMVVVLYIPSTSQFFCPFVQVIW